ncbi:MAG: TolC family protein [Candidatus Babeliaceae bacterium]|nr:TolC family protein [Candidatus Babeliaceae bacterium]
MERVLLLLGTLLCVSGCALQADTTTNDDLFSLEQLTAYATYNRSDLEAIDAKLRGLEQDEWIAWSGYMPQIKVSGIFQSSRDYLYPTKQGRVLASQVIFNAAGPQLEYDRVMAQEKITILQRSRFHDEIVRNTRGTYLDYCNQLFGDPYQLALAKTGTAEFRRAERENRVGTLSDLDLERARKDLQDILTEVAIFAEDTDKKKESLETTVEKDVKKLRRPSLDLLLAKSFQTAQTASLDEYLAEAKNNRPEFPIFDQEIELADIDFRQAAFSYMPTLSLNVGLYKDHYNRPVLDVGYYSYPWVVGLEMDWTFDGFANVARARKARAHRLEKVLSKKRAEFTIALEVKTAFHDFKNQVETLRKQVVTLGEARKEFLRQKKAYAVGLISRIEFVRAQSDWKKREYALAQAANYAAWLYEQLLFQAGSPRNRTSLILDASLPKKGNSSP